MILVVLESQLAMSSCAGHALYNCAQWTNPNGAVGKEREMLMFPTSPRGRGNGVTFTE